VTAGRVRFSFAKSETANVTEYQVKHSSDPGTEVFGTAGL
jgi:hypothetical protein